MSIDPIQLRSIGTIGKMDSFDRPASEGTATGFGDVFKTSWNNAVDTAQDLTQKQYLQSIGEIDDTHTVPIAAAKAELSLSMLINLRNKALESYNELMRIGM
ncbi:MAG: flagellar hook-basal body complex protein FliE [Hungatella sp.]